MLTRMANRTIPFEESDDWGDERDKGGSRSTQEFDEDVIRLLEALIIQHRQSPHVARVINRCVLLFEAAALFPSTH